MKLATLALIVFVALLTPVMAQEPCPDTLAWTRALAVKVGHSRAQCEMDAAQCGVYAKRLEVEVQQLREEISRLRSAEPKNKGASP